MDLSPKTTTLHWSNEWTQQGPGSLKREISFPVFSSLYSRGPSSITCFQAGTSEWEEEPGVASCSKETPTSWYPLLFLPAHNSHLGYKQSRVKTKTNIMMTTEKETQTILQSLGGKNNQTVVFYVLFHVRW
jgi:hypothetical protein